MDKPCCIFPQKLKHWHEQVHIYFYIWNSGLFDTIVAELEIVIHDYKKCFNEC